MKTLSILIFTLLTAFPHSTPQNSGKLDTNELIGRWKLDMSPHNKSDSNFAMMEITAVDGDTFEGEFYRSGVKIRKARLNTQLGIIYGALVSGDGTGEYNTAFYMKDGVLHGSTHALSRNFLAVWTATKDD